VKEKRGREPLLISTLEGKGRNAGPALCRGENKGGSFALRKKGGEGKKAKDKMCPLSSRADRERGVIDM